MHAPHTRTEIPGGVRIDMPPRDFGETRLPRIFFIVFGAVFALLPAVGIGGVAAGFFRSGAWWVAAPAVLLALPFIGMGLGIMLLGIGAFSSRSWVEVRHDSITALDRVGPVTFRRRRRARLTGIDIASSPVEVNGRPVESGSLAEAAALKLEFEGARPLVALALYRAPALRPAAEALARDAARLGLTAAVLPPRADLPIEAPEVAAAQRPSAERLVAGVRITESRVDGDPLNPIDLPEPPADTKILLEQTPDGPTITLPPMGLRKGSKGLFGFAIAWNAFILVFLIISGVMLFAPGVQWQNGAPPSAGFKGAFVVVPMLFLGVGVGMLLQAIRMGRRRAVLDVVGDALLITRRSPFGGSVLSVTRDQIRWIAVRPSGTEVNDRPLHELQIQLTEKIEDGRRRRDLLKLFVERSDDELRWLAALLRHALDVPAADAPTPIPLAADAPEPAST